MKGNKEVKISFWAAHATTVVSVTLVLLLVGILAFISVSAASETRRLREQIELSAIMADSVTNVQAGKTLQLIQAMPEVKSAVLVSSEQALQEWKEGTGEDLEELFGVNILTPEVSFNLKADYTSPQAMAAVSGKVASMPGVEEVAMPDSAMVQSMNSNISLLSLILGIVAIVMLVISFVLINNTVHLAIYSRRFTIHTMQLVGATGGFISRPFIVRNMLAGLLAGAVASGLLAAVLAGAPHAGMEIIASFISWPMFGIISASLIIIGMLICAVAAWISTSRYLHKDYGELFK
ncbi:MAG: permease-like cell division protein FtsX [Muribaculum sp.]|nr:permease-like cell division protein FtsX [Muribaculum sp.]